MRGQLFYYRFSAVGGRNEGCGAALLPSDGALMCRGVKRLRCVSRAGIKTQDQRARRKTIRTPRQHPHAYVFLFFKWHQARKPPQDNRDAEGSSPWQ